MILEGDWSGSEPADVLLAAGGFGVFGSIDVLQGEGGQEGGNREERKGTGRDRGKEPKGRTSCSLLRVSVTVLVEGSPGVRPCGKANNGEHLASPSLTARREALDLQAQDD